MTACPPPPASCGASVPSRSARSDRDSARVFLLTYYYPPDPAVGGVRPARVASALAAAGHVVHVITAAAEGKPAPGTRQPEGPWLWPVRVQRTLREAALALKAVIRRDKGQPREPTGLPAGQPSAGGAVGQPRSAPAWKRWIYSLMWLPDDRQGYIWPAYAALRRFSPTARDVVYTSGPPFSTHLAGLLISLRFGCRWVQEYRDPWSDNEFKPWWVRSRWADALEVRLQAACLKRADLIVAASEGIRARLLPLLPPLARSRALVVLNGIPDAPPQPVRLPPRPFRIVHAGTFYLRRDPRPFFRGLARVVARRRLDAETLRVDLVGHCRSFGNVSLEQEVQSLGLSAIVRFHDWLPQNQVEVIVRQAHLLLLMAQDQPDQIPNKLYDYLATRRPILAYADEGGETARMLRQFRDHIVLTSSNPDETEAALERALDRADTPCTLSADEESLLARWSTSAQMAQLIRRVEQLAAGSPPP